MIALAQASIGSLTIALLLPIAALATPVTISNTYNFIDNRGSNRAGFATGILNQFGANASPSGAATTGVATQAGALPVTLRANPTPVNQNAYFGLIQYFPVLSGSWTLTFQNGGDTRSGLTPDLVGASPLPFVDNVTFSGSGTAPIIRWSNPVAANGVQILIEDFSTSSAGAATAIHSAFLPGGTTSYRLPSTLSSGQTLSLGTRYSLEIDSVVTRDGTSTISSVNNILSRARAFFEFTPQSATLPTVYLPTASIGPGGVPTYAFHIDVRLGETYYIDPTIATGYTYSVEVGNPNFASVLLPTGVGDDLYELWVESAGAFADTGFRLIGGSVFDFLAHGFADGLSTFQIRGIEAQALVDAFDPFAFVTGVTFASNGVFTGTMTPIVAVVSEPETMALYLLGLMTFVLNRLRTKSARLRGITAGLSTL